MTGNSLPRIAHNECKVNYEIETEALTRPSSSLLMSIFCFLFSCYVFALLWMSTI